MPSPRRFTSLTALVLLGYSSISSADPALVNPQRFRQCPVEIRFRRRLQFCVKNVSPLQQRSRTYGKQQ
ncbi:hypothetical protein SCLCIDRAFT_180859 [Scleroderma citrinum Foug A]|uniref:Secreted protein n=1 Tax=Scleroderma citrinum Foug A TaxID=1036808 RepID=A0A0C3EG69_9AGAM|nr:hypothetical protein SCLCIDRAFT_180859 [Scleroderma citrinum Foug A]